MKRRTFLAAGAATAATLAAPRISRGADARVLKFIPQADPTIIDPIWTTAYVTRNHGFMIFDTLYGIDNAYKAQPQMVAGHTTENDGKTWKLTLRDGLMWHDGERVLAQGLRRLHQTLGRARHVRLHSHRLYRRTLRPRRQDHPVPPETALCPAARTLSASPAAISAP